MIRCAKKEDLSQIAQVHFECFPDSFSTKLGKGQKGRLLEKYYYEYLAVVPELFLVAENESKKIIGFCMGYYCENNNYANLFLKHNFIQICVRMLYLLLKGDELAWKKVSSMFGKKGEPPIVVNSKTTEFNAKEKGEILSICVQSEYRGMNIAKDLVEEYVSVLRKSDRRLCLLTVKAENARGVNFYKKLGFECYRKTDTTLWKFRQI